MSDGRRTPIAAVGYPERSSGGSPVTGSFDIVFFDVDSTLVAVEGIDVLARGDEEVARLTRLAMEGTLPVDDVYGRRLDRVRPSRGDVEALGETYLRSLTPGAIEVVRTLRRRGVEVHLVTGGIEQAVVPLAERLGIPEAGVHAVPLRFDAAGGYLGFDAAAPTARRGGKRTVVVGVRGSRKVRCAFVGDGETDLETLDVVERFVGFGGVAVRESVRRRAPFYVEDADLRAVLPLLVEAADG